MIEAVVEYLLAKSSQISENYGVNPFIFALLYFSTVPVFWVSAYYTARNYVREKPLFWPVTGLLVSQFACYIYLFASGQNLPWWVYLLVLLLFSVGIIKGFRQIRKKAQIQLQKVVHEESQA